ncbi:MAG TPA: CrcB family protein [Acidimicrobiales bacterium]|nr:CrcB family protein [Acidimicrobiales bacterium]
MSRPSGGRPYAVVAAVAAGGAVGALARDAIESALPANAGQFPWMTLLINLSGSLVLGVVLTALSGSRPRHRWLRAALCIGVIGAYTTFSTYVGEAVLLVRDHRAGTALVYVLSSVVAGVAAAWLGIGAARAVLRDGERRRKEVVA